ncbi:hypothetical protein HVE01_24760 [Vreelandella venusta]|nr:hypothetical protein HVE01_24760 [Halomonas venusta]
MQLRLQNTAISPPAYADMENAKLAFGTAISKGSEFARWASRNLQRYKLLGYTAVVLSTKPRPVITSEP